MRWLLVVAVLAGCSSSSSVAQRGVGPRPLAPLYDGQPMQDEHEVTGHVSGGGTSERASVARTQLGVGYRTRQGPTSDFLLTLDLAPSIALPEPATRPTDTAAAGLGFALRSAPGGEAFRLGVSLGLQGWLVPVADDEDGDGRVDTSFTPGLAAHAALVPSVRIGPIAAYLNVALLAALAVPGDHERGAGVRVETVPGLAASLGVRIDMSAHGWLMARVDAGAHDEGRTLGGTLGFGSSLD